MILYIVILVTEISCPVYVYTFVHNHDVFPRVCLRACCNIEHIRASSGVHYVLGVVFKSSNK